MILGPTDSTVKHDHFPGIHGNELEAFHSRVLAPFEDDKLFHTQLFTESSYLRKNPGLRVDIQALVQTDDDQSIIDMTELLDLSRLLDSPAKQTPFRAILSQLTLYREINDLKIEASGLDSSTTRANALMYLLTRKFVDAIPDDELSFYDATAQFVNQRIKSVKGLTGDQLQWFDVKSTNIGNLIEQRVLLEEYFNEIPDKDPSLVSPEEVGEDNKVVTSLFTQAREHQRYGVKIGYKAQDYRSGSLVFSPPIDVTAELAKINKAHPLILSKGENYPVALIVDSAKTSFGKKIAYLSTSTQPGRVQGGLNIDGREIFVLLDNGKLSTFHTDLDLAQIAAKKGTYHAYRQIQAEVLAGFIDLTSDLGVSMATKDIRVRHEGESGLSELSGADVVRKLLVPRIKALSGEHIDTDRNTAKEVRLHGVVWHIRRLPEGWHASPEALQLAQEAHIKLEDGETFVRAHQRGSKALGEVVIHNLVHQ